MGALLKRGGRWIGGKGGARGHCFGVRLIFGSGLRITRRTVGCPMLAFCGCWRMTAWRRVCGVNRRKGRWTMQQAFESLIDGIGWWMAGGWVYGAIGAAAVLAFLAVVACVVVGFLRSQ